MRSACLGRGHEDGKMRGIAQEEQHIHTCLRVNQEDSWESKGWKEEGRCMFKGWSQGLMRLVSQEAKGFK